MLDENRILFAGAVLPDALAAETKRLHLPVIAVPNSRTARRTLLERGCSMVVIDAPLSDEYGTELAQDLSEQSSTQVLMLVPAAQYELVAARAPDYGILVLRKPVDPEALRQTLLLMLATQRKLQIMQKKADSLAEKMADIRFVNRAKLLLMEHEHLTEAEAHKRIERQAMDLGLKRRQIAIKIIHKYE